MIDDQQSMYGPAKYVKIAIYLQLTTLQLNEHRST